MKRMACLLALTLLAPGCSAFTPPLGFPVYEQHAKNRVNTFSVIPSRRMVIVKSEDPGNPKEKTLLICAEASADVSDNLVSSLEASLAVSNPASATGKKTADVAAAIGTMLTTTAQFLFKRTQGIQLFRDGMYHLCQARMNGFLDDPAYRERADHLLDAVVPLIKMEIRYLQNTQPANNPGASEASGAEDAEGKAEPTNIEPKQEPAPQTSPSPPRSVG